MLKTTDGGVSWIYLSNSVNHVYTSLEWVYFPTHDIGYTVGLGGYIFKTTDAGNTWLNFNLADTLHYDLLSAYFINADTGYAVGAEHYTLDGVIIKTTNGGTTWTRQYDEYDKDLESVWFVNANTGWAAGGHGTILSTTNGGNTWNPLIPNNIPAKYEFECIFFKDIHHGYAVGYDTTSTEGVIYYYNGYKWALSNNPAVRLFGDYFTGGTNGWIIASNNTYSHHYETILKYDSCSSPVLTTQYSNTSEPQFLSGVYFTDSLHGWAVGANYNNIHSYWQPVILKYQCIPPMITVQPNENINLCETDTLLLTIVATGSSTITYQWQRNGDNISDATESALFNTNVAESDSGHYYCIVKGVCSACSAITSDACILTVAKKLELTSTGYHSKCTGIKIR